MAHYALLDQNNVVTQVITGREEDDLPDGITSWEDYYGTFHGQTCRRTSYNTHNNQHDHGGTPFRGHYAGIGYTYDDTRDAFIPPEPPDATGFDEDTLTWIAPTPEPEQP
jgi:hypothetical protein